MEHFDTLYRIFCLPFHSLGVHASLCHHSWVNLVGSGICHFSSVTLNFMGGQDSRAW